MKEVNVHIDRDIAAQLTRWGVGQSQAVIRCLNRYHNNPWQIKARKKGKTTPYKVGEAHLAGFEPWKVAAIIEDAVRADMAEAVPQPPKIDIDEREYAEAGYSGAYPYDQPGIKFVIEEQDD